jgi:class 3 adenylate cyclase
MFGGPRPLALHPEQHFRWTWDLRSPPEALWPLVSNTDRFNRDCGYPPVVTVPPAPGEKPRLTNTRRLRANVLGVPIVWDELAFEWLEPRRYAVERIYLSGPVARMVAACELTARPDGGTTLAYDMRVSPANFLGRLTLPFAIGRRARIVTERVFRRYDEFAQRGLRTSQLAQRPALAAGAAERLGAIEKSLVADAGQPATLVAQLVEFIRRADDLAAARMRPYMLADEWRADRHDTLQLFLHATRAGLLDFSWDLVCPHCRGAKPGSSKLEGIRSDAHCDSCNVDFTVNFDQSVELTFTPNASVRSVARIDYCVGGPQVTPHIVAQQPLKPAEQRVLPLLLSPGRYRVRTPARPEQHAFRVATGSSPSVRIALGTAPLVEPAVTRTGELTIVNEDAREHLAIVEHLAWSDQATTAAEVTGLQLFRDLFSSEVLRPGEQISVGSMTVVFTDLKNSTQLYKEIGDAPAFGRVLTHFEILKAAVAAENGAIVKTMGDAIMAVFPRPVAALKAMVHAQRWLRRPQEYAFPRGISVPPSSLQPLSLKAGIHCGPCLAINQNERLDYFGTTVNVAARLCGLCTGADLVLSSTASADAEVTAWLADSRPQLNTAGERVTLKGFGDEAFSVLRLSSDAAGQPRSS